LGETALPHCKHAFKQEFPKELVRLAGRDYSPLSTLNSRSVGIQCGRYRLCLLTQDKVADNRVLHVPLPSGLCRIGERGKVHEPIRHETTDDISRESRDTYDREHIGQSLFVLSSEALPDFVCRKSEAVLGL